MLASLVLVVANVHRSTNMNASANMNGDYLITRTSEIGAAGIVGDYATRGHEFFDVYSVPITSRYGETFWTRMPDVPLPTLPAAEERQRGKRERRCRISAPPPPAACRCMPMSMSM